MRFALMATILIAFSTPFAGCLDGEPEPEPAPASDATTSDASTSGVPEPGARPAPSAAAEPAETVPLDPKPVVIFEFNRSLILDSPVILESPNVIETFTVATPVTITSYEIIFCSLGEFTVDIRGPDGEYVYEGPYVVSVAAPAPDCIVVLSSPSDSGWRVNRLEPGNYAIEARGVGRADVTFWGVGTPTAPLPDVATTPAFLFAVNITVQGTSPPPIVEIDGSRVVPPTATETFRLDAPVVTWAPVFKACGSGDLSMVVRDPLGNTVYRAPSATVSTDGPGPAACGHWPAASPPAFEETLERGEYTIEYYVAGTFDITFWATGEVVLPLADS